MEQIRELGPEDYPFLSSQPPPQPWHHDQEDSVNQAAEENENDEDEEEEEEDKYVDEARVDPGGGEDKDDKASDGDEDEDDDSSSNDRPKDQIEGHVRFDPNRPQIRAHQGQERGEWGNDVGRQRGNHDSHQKLSLEMMQQRAGGRDVHGATEEGGGGQGTPGHAEPERESAARTGASGRSRVITTGVRT